MARPAIGEAHAPEPIERPDPRSTGDFERWIESSMSYVRMVALRYVGRGLAYDELLSAGNVGLVEAALRFDPERNVQFVTYATWWIRKSILKTIRDHSMTIRVPRYRQDQMRVIQNLRTDIRRAEGREPTDEEMAAETNMSIQGVRKLLTCRRPTVSLDQPLSEESGMSLGDQLPADPQLSDPEGLIDRDYAEHIRRMIGALHPRKRMVLNLRFGLSGHEPMTFREVGERLGLSRERVRQIEQQALSRLRQWLSRGVDPVGTSRGADPVGASPGA